MADIEIEPTKEGDLSKPYYLVNTLKVFVHLYIFKVHTIFKKITDIVKYYFICIVVLKLSD